MRIEVIFFLIVISAVFMSCVYAPDYIRGNGDIITDERTLSPFEKIKVSGNNEIRFHSSMSYRAVVTIDSGLNEYFETEVIGNVLNIRLRHGQEYRFTKIIVDVYCPAISDISLSGSCNFEMLDKIVVPVFKVNVSGSGQVNGSVECNNFSADISGSGNMNISGNSKDADISIAGSGNFNGNGFNIKNCFISISGSGNAQIFADDYLAARISGSGSINYRGNARIDIRNSGSGRIIGYPANK